MAPATEKMKFFAWNNVTFGLCLRIPEEETLQIIQDWPAIWYEQLDKLKGYCAPVSHPKNIKFNYAILHCTSILISLDCWHAAASVSSFLFFIWTVVFISLFFVAALSDFWDKKQEKSLITFPEGDNPDCCMWLVYTIFIWNMKLAVSNKVGGGAGEFKIPVVHLMLWSCKFKRLNEFKLFSVLAAIINHPSKCLLVKWLIDGGVCASI